MTETLRLPTQAKIHARENRAIRAQRHLEEAYAHGLSLFKSHWYAVMFDGEEITGVYHAKSQVATHERAERVGGDFVFLSGRAVIAAM